MEHSTAASSRPSCSARAALRTMSRAATKRVAISASLNRRYCQQTAPEEKLGQHLWRGLCPEPHPHYLQAGLRPDTLSYSGKACSRLLQGRPCEVSDGTSGCLFSQEQKEHSSRSADPVERLPDCLLGVLQTVCGQ